MRALLAFLLAALPLGFAPTVPPPVAATGLLNRVGFRLENDGQLAAQGACAAV